MNSLLRDEAVSNARSISAAADGLLRAARTVGADREQAAERLEQKASLLLGDGSSHFDSASAGATEPAEDDLLAEALSQLSIGFTLISAESVLADPRHAEQLGSAVEALNRAAETIEEVDAEPVRIQGFEARPQGRPQPVDVAAISALGEMADTAADVTVSLLGQTFKPLIKRLPQDWHDVVVKINVNLSGRFVSWGLRAVRRGLELLLSMVEVPALERVGGRIDEVLSRLDHGDDAAVLTGWAIGAVDVSEALRAAAERGEVRQEEDLLDDLQALVVRYASICKLLKRVTAVLTGLAAALALLHITLPHALTVTTAGLLVVLGALVVLGRDFTGATDAPGRVRGVGLLVLDTTDAST